MHSKLSFYAALCKIVRLIITSYAVSLKINFVKSMRTPLRKRLFPFFLKVYASQLVQSAYQGIFRREADESGLKRYTHKLVEERNLADILDVFSHSQEHEAQIIGSRPAEGMSDRDVFNGLKPDDAEKIKTLRDYDRSTIDGLFIDAVGIKVAPSYYPWIADRVGTRVRGIPLPNDGYFAEGIEYASLAMAFEMATDKSQFTCVEIGAGWGPWISASAVVAKRLGYKKVNLTAFEADEARYQSMRSHLDLNSLIPREAPKKGAHEWISWNLLNVAADSQNRTLYWPVTDGIKDAGLAAISTPNAEVDYRGVKMKFLEVEGRDIRESLDDLPVIDFMHIDIQGAEYDLIMNTLPFLEQHVRCIFVGTHSRKIEGDLIHELYKRKWQLLRERPCKFFEDGNAPELTGLTYVDGGQFWKTPLMK